jgi:hypothetical protein
MYGEEKKCVQVLVKKCEGERPLGKPHHLWEDNIEIDF